MSKIGLQPILVPEGISVNLSGNEIEVTGPKGSLKRRIPETCEVTFKEGTITLTSKGKSKKARALYGTTRAIIAGMVKGVSQGWEKKLELVGTGYRAEAQGGTLILTVGYSHPVKIEAPPGTAFSVEKSIVTISGADKELVGLVAAKVRAVRPPEPYKGKGIRYLSEFVRRKVGKAAKAAGAPA